MWTSHSLTSVFSLSLSLRSLRLLVVSIVPDYKLAPDWLDLVCDRFTSGRKPIISSVHHGD